MYTTTSINILLAFLEGLALILSPCILPLLPVLLAGSLEGSKKRPLGIILGFILSFALFSFFAKKIIEHSGIDLNVIRIASFGLLILFGIIMISDFLTEKFAVWMERLSNTFPTTGPSTEKGFFGGLFFGSLLGLVWTPCAGPILAAVIVQTVLAETTVATFFTLLAFGIGVSIPMLIIVLLGRVIMEKFRFFKQHASLIRKILGFLIIIGVILMINADKVFLFFSSKSTSNAQIKLERSQTTGLINGLARPYPAPPLEDIGYWINTKPIDLNDLKGKVVLIDFWAYSCINCIRTLPYLKSWYQKYRENGLVILGVHSPEFEFERDINNVKNAVNSYGILYPVLLDNHFSTWRNYQNHYWPATYLINKEGLVVYTHFGEGNYDITEENIRTLLGLPPLESQQVTKTENTISVNQTPETYLGYERANTFVSPEALSLFYNQPQMYTYPKEIPENAWALNGKWSIFQKNILAEQKEAGLKIHFNAVKVYAVMGSHTKQPIVVNLRLDGAALQSQAGKDVTDSSVSVSGSRLYELINLKQNTNATLELISTEPGLEIYTFTFGN